MGDEQIRFHKDMGTQGALYVTTFRMKTEHNFLAPICTRYMSFQFQRSANYAVIKK